jgi:hypothetical protein
MKQAAQSGAGPGALAAAGGPLAPVALPLNCGQFFGLFRRALQRALQWRLLLLWAVITAVPTFMVALPVWRALAHRLDDCLRASEWSSQGNVVMFADLVGQLRETGAVQAGSGLAATLLMLALVPLLNGMFVAAARAPTTLGLGELVQAGLKHYGPMLRLMLLALAPLGVALGLGSLMIKGVARYGEFAVLEADVEHLRWLALALGALLFAGADASLDAGRACLALYPSRRSAIRAWWRGFGLVVNYPARSVGLYLGITAVAGCALTIAAWLRLELPSAGHAGFLAGLLLTQLIAAIIAWMHFARQFAMFELARAVRARA